MTLISLVTGAAADDLRSGITINTKAEFSSSQPPKAVKTTRIQNPGKGQSRNEMKF
ncbi:hypothetical protein ABIB06_000267 [Bradyrhizobium sp. LB8.2]|uniref:hypothetical protein n=1 Tax=unclassified Bradyrhizobium TaxID=2631580 RepID=UPI00339565F3